MKQNACCQNDQSLVFELLQFFKIKSPVYDHFKSFSLESHCIHFMLERPKLTSAITVIQSP